MSILSHAAAFASGAILAGGTIGYFYFRAAYDLVPKEFTWRTDRTSSPSSDSATPVPSSAKTEQSPLPLSQKNQESPRSESRPVSAYLTPREEATQMLEDLHLKDRTKTHTLAPTLDALHS